MDLRLSGINYSTFEKKKRIMKIRMQNSDDNY
jgi:hypothetical protein